MNNYDVVNLPELEHAIASDTKVYSLTAVGKLKLIHGIPVAELTVGLDLILERTEPFRVTPMDEEFLTSKGKYDRRKIAEASYTALIKKILSHKRREPKVVLLGRCV